MKKIEKGEKGYLNYRKLILLLSVFILVVSVAVFFFTGYIRYKSTKSIFTVLAVLMVLPAAKQFVMYAVIAPYKSVSLEMYNLINEITIKGNIHLIADMVITSQEKVTNIDLICIKGARITGYAPHKKVDINFITKHLKDVISPNYKINQVKIYTDFDKYKKSIEEMTNIEEYKYDKDIANLILTQCV